MGVMLKRKGFLQTYHKTLKTLVSMLSNKDHQAYHYSFQGRHNNFR